MTRRGYFLSTLTADRGDISKAPAGDVLMAVFQDNYFPGRDTAGEPFAVSYDAPGVAFAIRGNGLRQRLASDMFELVHRMPGQDAQGAVLGVIEGLASRMPRSLASIRTARYGNGIAVDLGGEDGACALVTGDGWRLDASGQVLFRRTALTAPLPEPARGGHPGGAFGLVNIDGQDELAVYAACRVASLIPEITKPVEIITGQPGTVKTGTTRITVEWTGGAVVPMPKDPRDWAAMGSAAHTIGHDNVSSLGNERSDLLCKAASGDTWAARALYTNTDLMVIRFQPVSVVLNTIDAGAFRSDLVRRAACHYLTPPRRYLGDAEARVLWEHAHPGALGWLLDTLACVLRLLPGVSAGPGETMSDFCRVLKCVDLMWGTDGLTSWKQGQAHAYIDALEDDVIAMAITNRVAGRWHGTSTELLNLLHGWLPDTARGREWTPRKMSGALDRARPALEAAGWQVARAEDHHLKSRRILLVPPGSD